MYASLKPGRRTAATAALVALTTAGFVALAAPAQASGTPTVTLTNGTVTVTGTPGRNLISVTVGTRRLAVDVNGDGKIDAQFARSQVKAVQVFAGDGDDAVSVTGAGNVPVTINGGAGDDKLVAATPGQVTVHAGTGDDRVEGGGAGIGHETIFLGDGNDRFVSSLNAFVGARSDLVAGGAGQNAMVVKGSSATESVSLSAKAGRLLVDHDLRDFIDADNIQAVTWFGFGGPDAGGNGDQVLVGDLSGTDVTRFTPNFSSPRDPSSPNNSADILSVRGTLGGDHIAISGSGAHITIAGLVPKVTPVLLDSQDTIRIESIGGTETVDTTALQPGLVQVQVI